MSTSVLLILFAIGTSVSRSEDGICAQTLGYSVNNFLDKCFASHHFFAAMRAYSLKDLYKIFCCPGYREVSRVGRGLVCTPMCPDGCSSGTCIKPNTCQCEMGYFLKNATTCVPLCQPSCRNSHCIQVNRCMCNPGYEPDVEVENECKPSCRPNCVNGTCKRPGECECFAGYKFQKGSNRVCEPDCNPACVGGVCVSPGVCRCFQGHLEKEENMCWPVCASGCGVGNCTSPSTCSCPEGYEASPSEPCRPKCNDCVGGTCVSPGACLCPSGRTFEKKLGKCVKVCDPPCINGICGEDGNCNCLEGYALNENTKSCEPVCKAGCPNGRCVKPDQCECLKGYAMESLKCRPVCSDTCENATCVAPDICSCWEGYSLILNNSCSPVCSEGCGVGTCESPGNCTCPLGYEALEQEPCRPICSEQCENGFCVEPDVCICFKGYVLDEISGICILKDDDSSCIPKCNECINGICTEGGTCECLPGYNKRPQDQSICLPELGKTSDLNPMVSLNKFQFSSVLRHFQDNTFSFERVPQLTLNKNCEFLFQYNNDTADCANRQVDCILQESSSELDIHLYCQWPESTECLSTPIQNISTSEDMELSETWDVYNLSLSLEFPEFLAVGGGGYCTLCLKPFTSSKYFDSWSGLETLLVTPCAGQEVTAYLEGGGWNGWLVGVCAFLAAALLILSGAALLVFKTSFTQHYHNPETIEIVQVEGDGGNFKECELVENLYSEPLCPPSVPSTKL